MVQPTAVIVRPFNSATWIAGSAALGGLAGALFAVLVWTALAIALMPMPALSLRYEFALRHELALIAGVALLSLPALGQRRMLRGCGIDCRGYFIATMLGGWIAWNLPILAFGRLERIGRLDRFEEIDIGIALVGIALTVGALFAGWLQGWSMPHPLRPLWFRSAPFAALVAAIAATAVAIGFAFTTWDAPWTIRDPILGGLALATGWGVFAGLMARPIRQALRTMAMLSRATDATGPAVAAGLAIDRVATGMTATGSSEPPHPG
ncbi:MAG: hypothetical protein WD711_12400 [Dongiaceae bacterium]